MTKRIILLVGAFLVSSGALFAATYTVGSTGQDFETLSAAAAFAEAGDVIQLKNTVHTESGIVIEKDLTIEGESMWGTFVQGASSEATAKGRIIEIKPEVRCTLRNMTLQYGMSTLGGGAVYAISADVTLEQCRFRKNHLVAPMQYKGGGAVYLTGTTVTLGRTTIKNCQFDENSSNQEAGALEVSYSSLKISGCSFANNSSVSVGGALVIKAVSDVSISNSTFYRNKAGGTTGAIYLWNAVSVGNTLNVFNCSFVENEAMEHAGAVRSDAPSALLIHSSLFIANKAKFQTAFRVQHPNSLIVKSSIWIEGGADHFGDEKFAGEYGNQVVASLKPGEYGRFGGMTYSYKLPEGSLAINAGANPFAVKLDQRGPGYKRVVGGAPDVGAYESGNPIK